MYIICIIFNFDKNRYNGLCNSFCSLFYALLPMTEDGTTSRRLVLQCYNVHVIVFLVIIIHFISSSTRSDSFCRILLDIECVQTSIATLLIDKLIDFIDSPAAAR